MMSVRQLIAQVGSVHKAQTLLMAHYAVKKKRLRHDRRYAAMEFAIRFGPIFRRHAKDLPKAA